MVPRPPASSSGDGMKQRRPQEGSVCGDPKRQRRSRNTKHITDSSEEEIGGRRNERIESSRKTKQITDYSKEEIGGRRNERIESVTSEEEDTDDAPPKSRSHRERYRRRQRLYSMGRDAGDTRKKSRSLGRSEKSGKRNDSRSLERIDHRANNQVRIKIGGAASSDEDFSAKQENIYEVPMVMV